MVYVVPLAVLPSIVIVEFETLVQLDGTREFLFKFIAAWSDSVFFINWMDTEVLGAEFLLIVIMSLELLGFTFTVQSEG